MIHSTTQVVLYLKSGVTNGLAEIYLRHVRRTSLCAEGVVMYSRIQHSKRKKKNSCAEDGRQRSARLFTRSVRVAQLSRKQGSRPEALCKCTAGGALILDPRMRCCTARPRSAGLAAWPDYLHGCAAQKPAPRRGKKTGIRNEPAAPASALLGSVMGRARVRGANVVVLRQRTEHDRIWPAPRVSSAAKSRTLRIRSPTFLCACVCVLVGPRPGGGFVASES